MAKKLLFFCELSAGHLNVAITLARTILKLYGDQYEIWFLVNNEYQKKLSEKIENCKFLIYSRRPGNENQEDVKQHTIEFFGEFGKKWHEQDRVKFIHNGGHTYESCFEESKNMHEKLTELIKGLKPDVILIDSLMTMPTGINLGIPYVIILSAAPTFLGHRQLPPPRSGLSGEFTEKNRVEWEEFIKAAYSHKDFLKFMKKANNYLKEQNCPVNFDNAYMYYAPSPYLNVYNYPKELDYVTDVVKMPGNWMRIDSAVIDIPAPFSIPKKLKNLPGKLIYFSLGSMASCYKPLMNRLLQIFSQIQHRFIISTGLIGEQYELYDNQYGENFLDQLSVLQSVDVYITHGGNNGLTESCFFGVPMIVIPLFADQFDNARRIQEKNYGVRLSAFQSTKEEFEKAIEYCSNNELRERLQKMSKRIREENNLNGVCESIVNLIK